MALSRPPRRRKSRFAAEYANSFPGPTIKSSKQCFGQCFIPVGVRDFKRILREGSPSMVYDGTTVRTRQLRAGEDRLVVERLREVFAELSV